jgi:hypothetical protein
MGKCQQKNVWLFVYSVSVLAPPNQTLSTVQPGVQSDYFINALLADASAVATVIGS